MNPKEFLDTAERLLIGGNPSEADLRTAISRMYYSCYHVIRIEIKSQFSLALLQQAGLGGKTIEHAKLCMALKACGATAALGMQLEALKRERHFADYDLERVINLPRAQSTARDARVFHQTVDASGVAVVVRELLTHLQSIHGAI